MDTNDNIIYEENNINQNENIANENTNIEQNEDDEEFDEDASIEIDEEPMLDDEDDDDDEDLDLDYTSSNIEAEDNNIANELPQEQSGNITF